MVDISKMGKGGLHLETSIRDYRLELAPGVGALPNQYSIRDKIGVIKNQNGSSSCCSQAISYYTEVDNFIETGTKIQHSPHYLYSFVVQLGGGSYVKDNLARLCNNGIALESDIPSYENGNPPSEKFMTTKPVITPDIEDRAMTYVAKNYVTWDSGSLDLYKRAIVQGNGCLVVAQGNNILWRTQNIGLADNQSQMNWRHVIYLTGYDDSKKCFEFVNSWGIDWGDNGFGYLPYEYIIRGYVTNPYTIIDAPNGYYLSLMSILQNLKDKVAKLLLLKK